MDLKLSDIITIVIALAIPVIGFAVLIIPGAMSSVVTFLLQEDRRALCLLRRRASSSSAILALAHLPAHQAAAAKARIVRTAA